VKVLLNTLYVQTQGSYLRLDHETLKIEVERQQTFQMPLHHLGAIVAFGNVLISPFLIHRCAEDGRALIWLSEYGRFRARANGSTSGNVLLRQAQYSALERNDAVLLITRYIVAGKLQNARLILMRSARDAKGESDRQALSAAAEVHAEAIKSTENAAHIEKLRGIEGYAAKAYFAAFSHMIRLNRDAFALTERSRRPPRDPINAMLSFVYTLLVNDCVSACEGVGLDPQVGFLHTIRPGRPSLALDLMEELRAPIADRLVLTLINRGQVKPEHFQERPGGAIFLTDDARKTMLTEYQKRKQVEVNHPLLATKVPLGLVSHTQARLLARHLRGDIPTYQPFILR
jgi:CRISPR-associated protein Cas1